MIKSKVGSIKSGWKSVFMIFTAAADDEREAIAEGAFENVEQGGSLVFYHLILYSSRMCLKQRLFIFKLLKSIFH